MKIHRVTMTGFGPYRDTETVDFEEFSDDGLFVITGKTGAGKSSILDAITFALFGDVPRYGSVTDDSVRSKYLADSAGETRVELEFSQGDKRYRVTRIPSYTKAGNKNPTQQWTEIAEIRTDGTEHVLASRKVSEVAKYISEIVRLNAAQFKQVILLAQGAFQEFLLAKSDQRREVLRQLFNSGRYLDYSQALEDQARTLRAKLAHVATEVKTQTENLANELGEIVPQHFDGTQELAIVAWAEPLIALHAGVLAEFEAAAIEADQVRASAEQELNAAKVVAASQVRKKQAVELHQQLEDQDVEVENDRLVLAVARKAELVWLAIEAALDAEVALSEATHLHKSAEKNYRTYQPTTDISMESLTSQAKELASQISKLTEIAAIEASLPDLLDVRDRATRAEREAESHVTELNDSIQELQNLVPELKNEIAVAHKKAEDLIPASHELTMVTTQLTAAREAKALEERLVAAREVEIKALEAADDASGTLTSLKKRQYGQFAGVLARDLSEGKPCAVCGSTTHPQVAELGDDHVSDDQIERAEAVLEKARNAISQAQAKVTELNTKSEAAIQASGGQSVEDLEDVLNRVQARVDNAQAARDHVMELQKRQEELADQITVASESLSEAKVSLTAAQARAKQVNDDVRDKTILVDTARGDYESVTALLEGLDKEHDATEALLVALGDFVRARETHRHAKSRQDEALAEHEFAGVAEVKAARLPDVEQSIVAKRVQSYDEQRAIVNNILAEEALQDLPSAAIDLTPLEEAYAHALDKKSHLDSELGRVRKVHDSAKQLLAAIKDAFANSGAAQKEYETVDRLAQTVRGMGPNTKRMTLETFALAADLEEIVAAANVLLRRMTSGRYELRYSDEIGKHKAQSGLGLAILDAYNEELRPPESLSGGEKFQASLALALGLAEVVTSRNGGVRLDTLFIDEGFGALDDDTLDEVLDTIDALREGGRTVGLISHVEKVKERIHHHINVSVTAGGWSTLAG